MDLRTIHSGCAFCDATCRNCGYLVRSTPEFGLAVPLGRDALDLLAIELLAETGHVERAANLATTLAPTGPVALSRAWLRFVADDFTGTHELARDRPVVDDVSAALRILDARALSGEGDHDTALTALAPVLELPELAGPVEEAALGARRDALRASGREVEAQLIGSAESSHETSPEPTPPEPDETRPGPPLFGRSVTTALEDAWARLRREPLRPEVDVAMDDAEVQRCTDDAVALIASNQFDAAESHLLAQLDRADAWVDAGGPVVDELYVLLAGLFNQREMTPEEVATLERLRAAHQRVGITGAERGGAAPRRCPGGPGSAGLTPRAPTLQNVHYGRWMLQSPRRHPAGGSRRPPEDDTCLLSGNPSPRSSVHRARTGLRGASTRMLRSLILVERAVICHIFSRFVVSIMAVPGWDRRFPPVHMREWSVVP